MTRSRKIFYIVTVISVTAALLDFVFNIDWGWFQQFGKFGIFVLAGLLVGIAIVLHKLDDYWSKRRTQSLIDSGRFADEIVNPPQLFRGRNPIEDLLPSADEFDRRMQADE